MCAARLMYFACFFFRLLNAFGDKGHWSTDLRAINARASPFRPQIPFCELVVHGYVHVLGFSL